MNDRLYLYGFVDGAEPLTLERAGVGDPPADVYSLPYRDLAALVSRTEQETWLPVREEVLAHQRVLERALERYTVLPASFGTVAASEEEMLALLRQVYPELAAQVRRLAGTFEAGVKVL